MSRGRAPSRIRRAKAVIADALKVRKRIWVKPERMLLGTDRNGNPIFGSRIDSTLKVWGRECSPRLVVEGISKKPLGLVDDRLWDETHKTLTTESKAREKATRKALRSILDQQEIYWSNIAHVVRHPSNQPMVKIGETPTRTIYIEDEDGVLRRARIKARAKYREIGLSSTVPNYQTRHLIPCDEPWCDDDESNT